MRASYSRVTVLVGLAFGLVCCGGAPQRPVKNRGEATPQSTVVQGQQPSAPLLGRIEGEVEQSERHRKRMQIWGQVEHLRNSAHGQLPPLTATPSGSDGDPITKIRNQTQFKLTIWFAGKCSHQVEVPADTEVTAVFCAGRYNLAATVDDRAFLPLLREDQDFENGVQYRLEFFVEKQPR